MERDKPHGSAAGVTILDPISVLHLEALCADPSPIKIVHEGTVSARLGIYSDRDSRFRGGAVRYQALSLVLYVLGQRQVLFGFCEQSL